MIFQVDRIRSRRARDQIHLRSTRSETSSLGAISETRLAQAMNRSTPFLRWTDPAPRMTTVSFGQPGGRKSDRICSRSFPGFRASGTWWSTQIPCGKTSPGFAVRRAFPPGISRTIFGRKYPLTGKEGGRAELSARACIGGKFVNQVHYRNIVLPQGAQCHRRRRWN